MADLGIQANEAAGDAPPPAGAGGPATARSTALLLGSTAALCLVGAFVLRIRRGSLTLTALALVLVAFCIACALVLWRLNRLAKPEQTPWTSLADALDSSTFKAISVSLAIPLVLAFVASNLKIVESIRQTQAQRAQKARDDAVQEMLGAWSELASLSTKIAYFPRNGDVATGLPEYRRLLRETKSHIVEATAAVNGQFARSSAGTDGVLTSDDMWAFGWFFEVVLQASESTAWHIEHLADDPGRPARAQVLQDQLKSIQDGVAGIVDDALLSVLTSASKSLDEVSARQSQGKGAISKVDPQTRQRLDPVAGLGVESFRDFVRSAPSFSNLGERDARRAQDYKAALLQLPDNPSPEQLDDLWRRYLDLPAAGRVEANNVAFSQEYLEHLAAWMEFVSAVGSPPGPYLKRKDCITIAPPTRLGQGVVTIVDCQTAHEAEVYATPTFGQPVGTDYPGEKKVQDLARNMCKDDDYRKYRSSEQPGDPQVEAAFYYPTEFEWTKQNKRQVSCLVQVTSDSKLTRSVHTGP